MYARAYVRTIWTLRSCLKYSVVLPFCTSILLPPKENDLSCLYGLWHILKQDKEWMIVSLISSSCIRQWSKLTQLDFTQKRSSLSNYNRRDKVNETETGFKETHLLKHICKMVVYPAHLHRQTGRFTVWAPSKQNSGLVNFSPGTAFSICTNQFHLEKNGHAKAWNCYQRWLWRNRPWISVWNNPSGKQDYLHLHVPIRCSRKFPAGKTQKLVFLLLSTRIFRKLLETVNNQ